jgi:translation initiation factor IF-1
VLTIDDDRDDEDPDRDRVAGDDSREADSGACADRLDRSEPAVVVDTLPNKMLLVETRDGARAAVHAAGAMRMAIIRLVPGDVVRIERSPFDSSKGRIVGVDGGHPARVRRAPNESRRDSFPAPETAP